MIITNYNLKSLKGLCENTLYTLTEKSLVIVADYCCTNSYHTLMLYHFIYSQIITKLCLLLIGNRIQNGFMEMQGEVIKIEPVTNTEVIQILRNSNQITGFMIN